MRRGSAKRPELRSGSTLRGLLGLVLGAWPLAASAQDAQYWTHQYGPVAQLLGGAVVGSSRDLAATYYNPGGLGLSSGPSVLVSGESFAAERVLVTPVGGSPLFDMSSTRGLPLPSLVAGSFPQAWLGDRTHLAWSLLGRQKWNLRLNQRILASANDTPSGIEVLHDQRLTEDWAGLTLAHRKGDSLGIGVTLFGVYRSQSSRREVNAQSLGKEGRATAILAVNDYRYYHFRVLGKAGVAYEHGTTTLGLSLTTPSLGVYGRGRIGYTESTSNVDLDGDGVIDDVLRNADNKLGATYRSPWSVAVGAGQGLGGTHLHVTAEWFTPIGTHSVLDAPLSSNTPRLTQHPRGVLNLGLGVERSLGRTTSAYVSVATDGSSASDTPSGDLATATWNLYHLTAGSAFRVGNNGVTLGLTYALGHDRRRFGADSVPNAWPIVGEHPTADLDYGRLAITLGLTFGH